MYSQLSYLLGISHDMCLLRDMLSTFWLPDLSQNQLWRQMGRLFSALYSEWPWWQSILQWSLHLTAIQVYDYMLWLRASVSFWLTNMFPIGHVNEYPIMQFFGNPRHSANDSIYNFDWVFLEIPVKNCIVGMWGMGMPNSQSITIHYGLYTWWPDVSITTVYKYLSSESV